MNDGRKCIKREEPESTKSLQGSILCRQVGKKNKSRTMIEREKKVLAHNKRKNRKQDYQKESEKERKRESFVSLGGVYREM